jgi:hypothetical protein
MCFLLILAFGCNDAELLVAPDEDGGTSLAKHHEPKMVPFKGDATFAADLTVVPPVNDCGFGEQFFRRFNGEGNYSHLGFMTIVIESDECWINPDDFTLGTKGPMTITAANGDQLYGNWAGKMYGPNPDGGPNLWDFYAYTGLHPVEITGGTGRFEEAHGYVAGGGTFDRTTLTGTYWIDGMLSSVGSLK